MTEQEKHISTEAELRGKMVATNALITDEEILKLKDRRNRGVMIKTLEAAASIESPARTYTRERSYTFILDDIGVYSDPETGNKYLMYLAELDGQRFFTRMRWAVEERLEGQGERFLYEGTINNIVWREGVRSDDSTLWIDFPIWSFKKPGKFLEKDDDKDVDDFAQVLPLLSAFADFEIQVLNDANIEKLSKPEDFLTRGEFTFGGNEDYRIVFSVVEPVGSSGYEGRVNIKVTYPFDRSTSEYVSEDIEIPRSEFDRMIDELIGGYDSAEFSDGGVHFELIRTESGGVKFGFRKEEYCLDGSCVIDGITL